MLRRKLHNCIVYRLLPLTVISLIPLAYFMPRPYWAFIEDDLKISRVQFLRSIDFSESTASHTGLRNPAKSDVITRSSAGPSENPAQILDVQNEDFKSEYDRLACKFPILDPWDDSIRQFLSHPQPLHCFKLQLDLTYIDPDGYLRFNESEYEKSKSMYGSISCYYRYFDKLDDTDHSIIYADGGKYFDPPTAVRLTHENMEVKCNRNLKITEKSNTDSEVYWQIHAYPFLSNNTVRNGDDLSVLILGVDSISISAFKRHLPKTYEFMKNVMRFHTFNGHHKIGDNSFPNQMAVLMGKRVMDDDWPNMLDEMQENEAEIRFDHWPFVWKSYAEHGYETSFNEDTPHWGLFQYLKKGFTKKPVHHYYHPYWLAVEKGARKYRTHCFGNKPKLEMQLDLIRTHLSIGQARKWFDYVFATELFHQDEGYEAEKADPYLLRFFKDMHEGGYFNRTVIVFMSDHGHRYASLRQTLVGLVEERLPMLNIWFPQWFYKGNDFNATLRTNTVRLTTHFDVHETLLDILHKNYKSAQRPAGTRGLSLLYPIDRNRSCIESGVPPHYCTCMSEESMPVNDSIPLEAVKSAIAQINSIISNHSQCQKISLRKMMRVELLGVNEKIARGVSDIKSAREFDMQTGAVTVRPMNKLRVTFMATPGDAIFEAITAWNNWKSQWVVDGRIHRLNTYAITSACIQDRFLPSYCICKTIK